MREMLPDGMNLLGSVSSIVSLIVAIIFAKRARRNSALTIILPVLAIAVSWFLLAKHPLVSFIILATFIILLLPLRASRRATATANDSLPDEIVRIMPERPDMYKWLVSMIDAAKPPIHIDAMGVKCDAVYRVIKGLGPETKLPKSTECKIRVLVLGKGSYGAYTRSLIEDHPKVMDDVELYNHVWERVVEEHNIGQHRIAVHVFDFTPGFYIIRVNNEMIVGTYLGETGYESLTLSLHSHTGQTFGQFQRLFDVVWDRVSTPIGNITTIPQVRAA